jgi:hypothetical protein
MAVLCLVSLVSNVYVFRLILLQRLNFKKNTNSVKRLGSKALL